MSTPEAPAYPPEHDRTTTEPLEEWKLDKQGREYIARGAPQRGIIYRQGDETAAQARERDALPPDERRPRKRPRLRKVPDPPREPDLKELERILTEALKQPGLIAAAFGDEWAAEHFVQTAPAVSRNLVVAAQHNTWLKRKLEDMATGQDAAMAVLAFVPLTGAVLMYVAPPIIYWLDLPVSPRGREMLGVPYRKGRPAPSANGQPPPFAPASTAAPPPTYATPAPSPEPAPPPVDTDAA